MSLQKLSNQEVLANVSKLISTERGCTAKLIAHLAEIERRSLHLEFGFRSMFEYCVKELLLDETQAWLRLQVARKYLRFPVLLEELARGRLSLTVCGRLAPHLTRENCERLVKECCGMTRKQVEEYLVTLKPKAVKQPSLRRARTQVALFSEAASVAQPSKPPRVEPATAERYNLSLSIGSSTKQKLDRLAQLLGKDSVKNSLEDILDLALDAALDKKDPQRKAERVKRRKQKLEGKSKSATNTPPQQEILLATGSMGRTTAISSKGSRYIPAMVRREVLHRSGYRCEYVGKSGRRCSAKIHLEFDHLRPYGMGGTHAPDNLRVACKAHNLAKAKRDYGESFIKDKTLASQSRLALQRGVTDDDTNGPVARKRNLGT